MLLRKLILTSIILVTFFLEVATANCYFIRLNGYNISQRLDVFSWGELSPLIALETGDYYNLSPPGKNKIDITNGEAKNLQGELYYIPQNLIDKNNQFSLKIMVIERDEESPDDLVLPVRERSISLTSELFFLDSLRINLSFEAFDDIVDNTPLNKQSYQFEILRDSQNCSLNTAEGEANDLRFRSQNKLRKLHLHIKHYEESFLSGSHEYQSYRLPKKISKKSLKNALDISRTIATINANELISLGTTLEKFNKVENYSNIWREYMYLVRQLLGQKITIEYMKEKKWEIMEVPSLRFHPNWEKLSGGTDILPPKNWKVLIDN